MNLPFLYHFSCSTRADIHHFETSLALQSICFKNQRHLATDSLDCPILCLQYGKIAEHNSPTLMTCQAEPRMSFLEGSHRYTRGGHRFQLENARLARLLRFASSYFRKLEEGSRSHIGKRVSLVFQELVCLRIPAVQALELGKGAVSCLSGLCLPGMVGGTTNKALSVVTASSYTKQWHGEEIRYSLSL